MSSDAPQMQHSDNVDPAEIAKFEALAERWWDREGEFKPLHDINPLRANYIEQRSPVKGLQVLDVGCGGGILAEALAQRGALVTAIDMGEAPLAVAKQHQRISGLDIDYRRMSAEDLVLEAPERFDVVTCLEMLEHVPDPGSVIDACARMCKPGGDIYFSTINRNLKSFVMAIVGAEYVLNLLPRGTHEYGRLIKPSEMSRWIREAGLQLEDITGMTLNPFTGRYKLGKDIDVNYLVHAHKPARG